MPDATPPTPTPTGILLIDKPLGPTSMDVCRRVRWRLVQGGAPKRVKVGHGGTLDPLATGLLVVLVGKATPLCDQVMRGEKEYLTTIDLSAFSTTDDAEGERTPVSVTSPPCENDVRSTLEKFVGVIQQRPPAFSAMKVDGQRAYDLARAGNLVELPARPVTIHAIALESYAWPLLSIRVLCGKGTYIRSLARDIGTALGVGGYLTALRRTRTAEFRIENARTLQGLPDVMTQADLSPVEVGGLEKSQ
ncbi:MAG: tRNA pseudouridine(55) synthase TruB [Phycisphaerales bacterium]|nr:tRNA pseudouridine(55) synthase TruB [Phycisphaerales bacterium]